MSKSFAFALSFLVAASSADACMTFVVGKKASATGRVIVGHNEDDWPPFECHHGMLPARDWPAGTFLPATKGCNPHVPQAAHTLAFYWSEVKFPYGDGLPTEMDESATAVERLRTHVEKTGRMLYIAPAPGRTDGRVYYHIPTATDYAKPSALLVFLHGGDGRPIPRRSVISARTAVRCRPSRMRRFFVWSLDKRRDPYAKRCAVVTPCGSRHPDCENVVRSRWLELTMADSDRIEVDGVALEGPDVAATPADLARLAYRLEKRACPQGARLVAENLGGNRFRVKTENVNAFRIFLSPKMGDLAKPFTVDFGGGHVLTVTSERIAGSRDYIAALTCTVERDASHGCPGAADAAGREAGRGDSSRRDVVQRQGFLI